jgi:hypothetical protein
MVALKTYALYKILEMKVSRETISFLVFDTKTTKHYTVVFDTQRVILHSVRSIVVRIDSRETIGMLIDYKV